ncbi:hypothetical protein NWP10_07715 [Micrococcus sp. HG099]|uniref:hypothetical protein n=1 Tax=Micrococcus sp. HG099 TaxID=2969755 RepID=UPI00215B3EEE|nr:hypothetical protein [Micrococcus sp. HG099]MCR8675688.1 hypothetical protein [Micrococcus sp. HG099]
MTSRPARPRAARAGRRRPAWRRRPLMSRAMDSDDARLWLSSGAAMVLTLPVALLALVVATLATLLLTA